MVVQLLWAEGDNLLRNTGLQRANLGAFERYKVFERATFTAFVGVAFWLWPVL